jgi:hypothetical protein
MAFTYHLQFRCPTCSSEWREFRKLDDHGDIENQVSYCKECWRTEFVGPTEFAEVE